jgi:hypothetical protein
MRDQTISHLQDSNMIMKGKGCRISNQLSDTIVGDLLSEILDPSSLDSEPFSTPL